MGGLTSTSPGGSTAPSLTEVPAETDQPFLDHEALANMDRRTLVKDPTKYLGIITQYCRGREYHGMQLLSCGEHECLPNIPLPRQAGDAD
jgi:hypothetical protein